MERELNNLQKKEWARMLYCAGDLSQKEIALKIGSSEKTISKWVNENHWDTLRKSLLTTKAEQLRFLYDQLDAINRHIATKDEGKRYADSKESDIIAKTTASIKNLETETSIGELMEAGKQYIRFLQTQSLDKAKENVLLFDAFIKMKMKTN